MSHNANHQEDQENNQEPKTPLSSNMKKILLGILVLFLLIGWKLGCNRHAAEKKANEQKSAPAVTGKKWSEDEFLYTTKTLALGSEEKEYIDFKWRFDSETNDHHNFQYKNKYTDGWINGNQDLPEKAKNKTATFYFRLKPGVKKTMKIKIFQLKKVFYN